MGVMVFGEPPAFDSVIAALRKLEEQINKTGQEEATVNGGVT